MNRKSFLLVIGVVLVLACSTAQAGVIRFEDDDVDFLLNSDLTPKTSGTVGVGDVLVSVVEITTFTYNTGNLLPAGSELTGLAVLQVDSITSLGGGFLLYDFQAYSGGFNAVSPVDVANGDAGEGALIAVWLDSSADLSINFAADPTTNCTSYADCLAKATDGVLQQVDGFAGDLDEFWQALINPGGDDISTVQGLAGDFVVGQVQAALTTFENNIPTTDTPIAFRIILSGLPCATGTTLADGCIAGPVINGEIDGGAGLNPDLYADGAFGRSDTNASKLTTAVPEPSTLMLMGIGMLGLAAALRRRR